MSKSIISVFSIHLYLYSLLHPTISQNPCNNSNTDLRDQYAIDRSPWIHMCILENVFLSYIYYICTTAFSNHPFYSLSSTRSASSIHPSSNRSLYNSSVILIVTIIPIHSLFSFLLNFSKVDTFHSSSFLKLNLIPILPTSYFPVSLSHAA